MKFQVLLVGAASLASMATGAAVPQPEAVPVPVTVADAAIAEPITKRETNGANCWKYQDEYTSYWRLSTWGTWDQDWGHGLLDNLRGQCSYNLDNVEEWGFGYEAGPPPTNGWATFRLQAGKYDSGCVLAAIYFASKGAGQAIEGAKCWDSDKWW